MLTIHVRDASGQPVPWGQTTVALFVALPGAPGTRRLPEGSGIDVAKPVRRLIDRGDVDVGAVDRLIDSVQGWRGILNGREPLACTRSAVRAVLLSSPEICQQVTDAVRELTAHGMLNPDEARR